MAPLGNSISLRLIGFLLGAVVLVNLAMAVMVFAPAGRARDTARLPLPAQAAAIVEVLEAAPAADRPRLLAALNSASVSVKLVDALPPAAAAGKSAPILTRFLERYDDAFASRDVHVDLQRRSGLPFLDGRRADWRPVRLYVHLRDGPWVAIEPVRSVLLAGVLARGLAVVGLVGLVVIVLLVFAVRQTARPIEKLAAGARAFAQRLDAPDLETTKGPRELRALAAAFNEMKMRIRSLVHERTRLVAAIAHDLRTYMTRLRMRAEFISDPVQRERAERDIEEMSDLIGDTLLFARATEGREEGRGRTDVSAELEAFLAVRKELGDAVSFRGALAPGQQAVIEPVALRRILANLTDNAIRYGGAAEIAAKMDADSVVIDVLDRGPGIPESELDRVVAPFERLEYSRGRDLGGAGLGLAIVKALVDSHGGEFALLNRSGGGAWARVTLKAAPVS